VDSGWAIVRGAEADRHPMWLESSVIMLVLDPSEATKGEGEGGALRQTSKRRTKRLGECSATGVHGFDCSVTSSG